MLRVDDFTSPITHCDQTGSQQFPVRLTRKQKDALLHEIEQERRQLAEQSGAAEVAAANLPGSTPSAPDWHASELPADELQPSQRLPNEN